MPAGQYTKAQILTDVGWLDCTDWTDPTWEEYALYGTTFEGASGDERFMFTGHQWDGESGLYYAPFRYYSPFQARWTTRDPLGMVDGPNVYAYVRGNPLRYIDPLGLSSECISGWTNCLSAGIDSAICHRCFELCGYDGVWPTKIRLFGENFQDGRRRDGVYSCGPGPDLPPVPAPSPRRVPWGALGGAAALAAAVVLVATPIPGARPVAAGVAAAGIAMIATPPTKRCW